MSTKNSKGQRALNCPASASLKQENIAAEKSFFFFQSSPSFLRFPPQMAWQGLKVFNATIFTDHLMPRAGFKLMSVHLHHLEVPSFRTLYPLSYRIHCQ